MRLLEMFAVSLLLTLILELPIAYCFGIRGRKGIALVILVNILTNPAAVLLCRLGAPQLAVELGVAAVEAAVYLWFSHDEGWKIPHPIWMAVVCNMVSWLTGMLLQGTGGLL